MCFLQKIKKDGIDSFGEAVVLISMDSRAAVVVSLEAMYE